MSARGTDRVPLINRLLVTNFARHLVPKQRKQDLSMLILQIRQRGYTLGDPKENFWRKQKTRLPKPCSEYREQIMTRQHKNQLLAWEWLACWNPIPAKVSLDETRQRNTPVCWWASLEHLSMPFYNPTQFQRHCLTRYPQEIIKAFSTWNSRFIKGGAKCSGACGA